MKKRKEKKVVEFHQHRDEHGNIFGMKHPLKANHNNKETKKKHDITIKVN